MSVRFHEPMCFDSAQDLFWWIDHFLGDQIQDEWRLTGDAGGGASVIDQQTGGICRLDTGVLVDDDYLIDWGNIRSLLVTKRVCMETRVKLNQNTYIQVWFSLRFDGLNEIRFYCFDNFGGAHNWQITCIDGGAGGNLDTGVAVDTSYHIFRMECHTHGGNHVHFYIDGTETNNSPIAANIPDDATDFLDPTLFILTRTTAERSMDVDYVAIRQDR